MGGAEGLQVVTEVTPYALLFGLVGRRRREALDCCTAPLGQKTIKNCKNKTDRKTAKNGWTMVHEP